MSSPEPQDSFDWDPNATICDYCGMPIRETNPDCPARDEGVCAP